MTKTVKQTSLKDKVIGLIENFINSNTEELNEAKIKFVDVMLKNEYGESVQEHREDCIRLEARGEALELLQEAVERGV